MEGFKQVIGEHGTHNQKDHNPHKGKDGGRRPKGAKKNPATYHPVWKKGGKVPSGWKRKTTGPFGKRLTKMVTGRGSPKFMSIYPSGDIFTATVDRGGRPRVKTFKRLSSAVSWAENY